jgi:hypothetical protein
LQTLAPNELASGVQEQERIDAILKAFHRLPGQEVERFQLDLDRPVQAGTPEAAHLFEAWRVRQAELKEAMKTILQPAEHMANLTRTLNGTAPRAVEAVDVSGGLAAADPARPLDAEEQVYILRQLESLLDDVDNARDFHTIGAWPTLLSFLRPAHPASVRAAAAWAVGTAVKNTYDYQLWVLEQLPAAAVAEGSDAVAPSTVTAVEQLVHLLATPAGEEDFEVQKRALYALSAAMRGNVDVQAAILRVTSTDETTVLYLQHLLHFTELGNALPAEVQRKVWASAADLLEERAFIRKELSAEVQRAQQRRALTINSSEAGAEAEATAALEAESSVLALQAMPMLGDALVSAQWLRAASKAGTELARSLLAKQAVADAVSEHAALRSILAFCKEALTDSPHLYTAQGEEQASLQLQLLVRTVTTDFERESGMFDALTTAGDELAVMLGLLDQGANSAVF